MPRSARKAPGDPTPLSDGSKRFTIGGHPYRLRHFAGMPDREPPPETVVIPSQDGAGVFWLSPELLRIMRDESSSA